MSMSWDHKCKTCGEEFSSFAPRDLFCYKCVIITKIKDLPLNKTIKICDSGGFRSSVLFVKDLIDIFGNCGIIENDPDFKLVLEHDELIALSNYLGRKIELIYER